MVFSHTFNYWSWLVQVIIGCIGLIANSVGVFIFIKIGNVFNLSLAGLAIVDNLSIAALFVQFLVDNDGRWEQPTLRVFRNAACDASVLIVTALAYERYRVVTKPFKYQSVPSRKPWKR